MPAAQTGVAAYLVCSTQWRTGGMGGRTGLDYAGCTAALSAYLPEWQDEQPEVWRGRTVPKLLQDLQVIETAFLTAWGEKTDAPKKD